MNAFSLLPDNEPVSRPSERTLHGGDPDTLGRIDHYDLLRKLGGGGFGVVYLARDSVSGVEVAIKTLHPLLKRNAEEMDLLREKFRLVHGLTHPNIAKALVIHLVREINVWDEAAHAELKLSLGDSVMVMDYAPGVTLSKWRRQFPDGIVPFDLALEIGRPVAAALDYAHGERIVHRDVKPSNVMVETVAAEPRPLDHGQGAARSLIAPTLRVRILDFGLAAEIRSSMSRVSTESGDTSGTRPYMAPEQWLGKKQDGRTDQYALACVLYELLSGAPPFAGVFETGDPGIMKDAVVRDAPEEIGGLGPATNEALLRALAKAPKDRFPSCAAFVDAISSLLEHPEGRDGSPEGRDGSMIRAPFRRAVGASLQEIGDGKGERISGGSRDIATREADALRRKVALTRSIASVSKEDRADEEFGGFVSSAETELAVSEEAFRFGRVDAAIACLDRADAALASLGEARLHRAKAILHAREEEFRKERERREEEFRKERERREEERRNRKPGEVQAMEFDGVAFNLKWIPGNEAQTGFWMGETPVTQRLWMKVMGNNPSHFLHDGRCPVEQVSLTDCRRFLERLNEALSESSESLSFRLPSEEEWEFACRAGAEGEYCKLQDGSEIVRASLGRVAWYSANSDGKSHPVGRKEPNAWGLYDMHGNVWEWTETAVDGEKYISRGGSWGCSAGHCGSSDRGWDSPSSRDYYLGFRLCASEKEEDRPAKTTN